MRETETERDTQRERQMDRERGRLSHFTVTLAFWVSHSLNKLRNKGVIGLGCILCQIEIFNKHFLRILAAF